MDKRDARAHVLDEIARRARTYVPEWRFNPDSPDAGAALAFLWADMFAGTLERFERLPDVCTLAMLDELGPQPLPAVAANGWLAFRLREDAGEVIIPAGTTVSAPSRPEAALVTAHALSANPAQITDVYGVLPFRDAVSRFDRFSKIDPFRAAAGDAHIWTFRHPFAFRVRGPATLRILPNLRGGGIDALAVAPWEYLDGDAWKKLEITRDGAALLCVGSPDCEAIRVTVTREAVGDLELLGFTVKSSGRGLFPKALYAGDTQEADGFYPFGQRFLPGLCAYFAHADALTKPGARVELSFTVDYQNFEIEGYAETEIHLRRLMKVSDFGPPKEYEITAAQVKWEYFNGVGWAALGVENASDALNGQTNGRMKIAFDCPGDLRSAVVGAHDLPFIRARLTAADNLFRQRGYFKSPRLSDVRFDYRSAAAPITSVQVTERFDTRDAALPTKLAAMPDGPAAVYFAFDRAFARGSILFDVARGAETPALRWEYLAADGWVALGVRDDASALCKTGVLNYRTTASAAQARLWGRDAYWMRLSGEGTSYEGDDSCRPRIFGIYENAVRAEAKIAGEASVLPAGAFATPSAPIPGVLGVHNPLATYGGAEAEDERRMIARLGAGLSGFGRAVTPGDYETLAKEASVRVERARHYANADERGDYAYGESCLILLPRGAETEGFHELRDEVYAYIAPRRALGSGKLHILPPRTVAVNVFARVAVENLDVALSVKNGIEETLRNLLNPMEWTIGRLPSPGAIDVAIRAVAGVSYLIKTETAYVPHPNASADYARAIREKFVLPINGAHEIVCEEA